MRQKKKGFSFFFLLWGSPVQKGPQNPAPAGCLFSTRKTRSDVPEKGFWGRNLPGERVGWTGQKKEKRMRKKKWADSYGPLIRPLGGLEGG